MEAQEIKTLLYNTSVLFLFLFTEIFREPVAIDLIRIIQEACVRFRKQAADFEEPLRTLSASCNIVFPWAELVAVPEDLFIVTNAFCTLHSAYCMVVPFEDM